MGLFKKKIKKHEQINLQYQEQEFKEEAIVHQEESPKISLEQMINEIIQKNDLIIKKNNVVTNEYYICKILSRVGLKDLDFNMQVISLDKHINKLKKDCFNLHRFLENVRIGYTPTEEEVLNKYRLVNEMEVFQVGLLNQLNEINNNSYSYLRMSTVSVCLNKSNEELEKLYEAICEQLKGFKSFEEASEYIFYYSGSFIDSMIHLIIQYVKGTKNNTQIELFTWNYFFPTDAIISIEYNEWIDLYNKVKFVIKKINQYDEHKFQKISDIVLEFEAKYAILMMHYDRKNGK